MKYLIWKLYKIQQLKFKIVLFINFQYKIIQFKSLKI